jgi:hypothetical protein
MHLIKKTTFEWNGRQELTDLRVDSHQPKDGGVQLMIKSVSVWADTTSGICMRLEFATEDGSEVRGDNWKVAHDIIRALPFGGHCSVGMCFHMSMAPVSGTQISESMMNVLLDLFGLVEIYNFPTPRLITEGFVGKDRMDRDPMPYGEYLKKTVMRRRAAAQACTDIDESVITF